MADTTRYTFRLEDSLIQDIDWLCKKSGGISRSDVVRIAVKRMKREETEKENKSGKISPKTTKLS